MPPVARDAFVAGDYGIRFVRNAAGRVVALQVNTALTRNFRFDAMR
jgi:hypothetical protein